MLQSVYINYRQYTFNYIAVYYYIGYIVFICVWNIYNIFHIYNILFERKREREREQMHILKYSL